MEWRDEGIVVGVRRHGESSVLLELMTRYHGRHLGLVRGGRSARMQPVLQPGNGVEATWRARLEDQLGTYTVEGTTLRAGELMGSAAALYGLGHIGQLLRLLPERDPHPALYEALPIVLGALGEPRAAGALMVRFEIALLAELGVGLDLSACAVTGGHEDLAFVSPKSGRAVSRDAAGPWLDRLLVLPPFLHEGQGRAWPSRDDIAAGFALTGHFLARNVYEARGLAPPDTRAAFVAAVLAREGDG
ncbi:DNA repair protein RecO [uncultured Alsobacter sp.]|uniref:DNA repair protein RecO n=1 Tax=uncultured Alsobacter sp. TaxID=1748258 RepID=UPI0025D9DBE0|nr:DNA repair protein RecO [uncultured Alsobacter sp.]